MGAELGDLIQLVDNQSYLGQQVLNVYYYRVTASLGLADPYLNLLNDAWSDTVLTPVKAVQSAALEHVSREWRNLTNGVDLFTDAEVIPGAGSATPTSLMPSYVSIGFLMQRESLATRNGYKRFAGMNEANISGNTWVGGAGFLTDIAAGLASDLFITLASVAEPVIVKRPITTPVTSYVYSSVGGASFRSIGTQNSRKAGRGV